VKLPTAGKILAALEAAGHSRTVDTVYSWTAGRVNCPLWAVLAIADGLDLDMEKLVRELHRRWAAKH